MAVSGIPGNGMYESTTAASSGSLIYAVPDDLIQTVLQHLSATDLCHVASCCRWLRDATNQDSLWLPLCQSKGWKHYGTTTDLAKIPSYGPSEQAGDDSATFQNDRIVTDDNTAGLTSTCRWKGVYMRAHHLDRNWATNCSHFKECHFDLQDKPRTDLRTHSVDGDLLAMYNFNQTIHVYDIRNQTLQCVINSACNLYAIKFTDGVIVVPCDNGRVDAFDARTGQTLQTIEGNWGHNTVSLFFDGELVLTCVHTSDTERTMSTDICVWCVEDGLLQRIITVDHTDDVCVYYTGKLDYRDKMLAAVCNDDHIHVWDARSGECLHQLECPRKQTKVQLGDNVIFGFSTKGDVCVTSIWSQETGDCQKVIDLHVGLPTPYIGEYYTEIINNLILLEIKINVLDVRSSVKTYNLLGEFVNDAQLEYNDGDVKGNGSKGLFNLFVETRMGREDWKGVVFNATPTGLVRLFDAGPFEIIWLDEIRMILFDHKENKLSIHHYW
ncbi:F-box/WD repeat-containing protein 7-like [Patiria miniata]|uniref:F-box domain-containing protein n=1 Tax=Patiria miniata TaxID=46514 RepID=A0A914AMN9_PATMI|nr:F-box/WD repeat-containing protein 7-like [Patiria miniata]